MFEAVEFVEVDGVPSPTEQVLGEFQNEELAVETVRGARREFLDSGSDLYAWWIVRKSGATIAEFIADSKSNKEFVLDISSGQLVEV